MPKRHRQPEPIEIQSAAHRSHAKPASQPTKSNTFTQSRAAVNASAASSSSSPSRGNGSGTSACDSAAEYSPGELKLVEETRRMAMDFPATPDTLTRHRRQQEADAKRRRVSYDHEGQPVTSPDSVTPAAMTPATSSAAARRPVVVSEGFTSGMNSQAGAAIADVEEEELEEADESDLSSNDYVGDDGNQPSSDSGVDSDEHDDDASELRGLRRAMQAAAAQRRRPGDSTNEEQKDSDGSSDVSSSSIDWEGEEEEEESDDDSSGADSGALDASEEEEQSDEGASMEDEENEDGAVQRDSDDDDDDDDSEGGLITVDFGVFDMEQSNIDGVIHLMDQLCPDKMNEVDRDDLGRALYESPFTSVVRLQNNGEDATGDEAQEFYGLSSVLDVAHGQELYPKALRPFCELLQQHVWRQAASGIPPTDILTSVVDDGDENGGKGTRPASRAKCLLLISEYIRNIPLELTVQILEDVLDRLDAARKEKKTQAGATHDDPIFATQPSMLAVLAKVQRATDAPVTLPRSGTQPPQQRAEEGVVPPNASSSTSSTTSGATGKRHSHHAKRSEKGGAASSGAMAAPEAPLDLTHYIFWREEDSILYEFRDKRVAALVYRCRPQYDGQPEHEIPLSILFVLQYGAVRQAVDEMKRRQTVNAAIERY